MRKTEQAGVQMTEGEIDAVAGGNPIIDFAIQAALEAARLAAEIARNPGCYRDGQFICIGGSIRG